MYVAFKFDDNNNMEYKVFNINIEMKITNQGSWNQFNYRNKLDELT